MIRVSFRQSMLAGFLLIASLLGWAAVRSWFVLEQFVDESRRSGEHVLQLSGSIQEIADRTVDLERSARQFAVLNPSLTTPKKHLAESIACVPRKYRVALQSRNWRFS
jgi:two-component system sensor histidine kinase GlrK